MARFGRPFGGEGVAGDLAGVDIPFDSPGVDDLVALLLQFTEGDEVAVDGVAGLFVEFAPRGGQRVFIGVVEALGDRPNAVVLLLPERPAGVGEEELQFVVAEAIEEEAGGVEGHGIDIKTIMILLERTIRCMRNQSLECRQKQIQVMSDIIFVPNVYPQKHYQESFDSDRYGISLQRA